MVRKISNFKILKMISYFYYYLSTSSIILPYYGTLKEKINETIIKLNQNVSIPKNTLGFLIDKLSDIGDNYSKARFKSFIYFLSAINIIVWPFKLVGIKIDNLYNDIEKANKMIEKIYKKLNLLHNKKRYKNCEQVFKLVQEIVTTRELLKDKIMNNLSKLFLGMVFLPFLIGIYNYVIAIVIYLLIVMGIFIDIIIKTRRFKL